MLLNSDSRIHAPERVRNSLSDAYRPVQIKGIRLQRIDVDAVACSVQFDRACEFDEFGGRALEREPLSVVKDNRRYPALGKFRQQAANGVRLAKAALAENQNVRIGCPTVRIGIPVNGLTGL